MEKDKYIFTIPAVKDNERFSRQTDHAFLKYRSETPMMPASRSAHATGKRIFWR